MSESLRRESVVRQTHPPSIMSNLNRKWPMQNERIHAELLVDSVYRGFFPLVVLAFLRSII